MSEQSNKNACRSVQRRGWTVDPITSCWNWNGAVSDNGYGAVWCSETKRVDKAHRAVYRIHKGDIPTGKDLDHLCRNRRCVNPDHLEPVSRATNARRGAKSKLTETQVTAIRFLNEIGIGYRRLANMFDVHRSTVGDLITNRHWKGVQ